MVDDADIVEDPLIRILLQRAQSTVDTQGDVPDIGEGVGPLMDGMLNLMRQREGLVVTDEDMPMIGLGLVLATEFTGMTQSLWADVLESRPDYDDSHIKVLVWGMQSVVSTHKGMLLHLIERAERA